MRTELWDVITDGFGLDSYPALVVAEGELGIRDLGLEATSFTPKGGTYAIIEGGIMVDKILSDPDDTRGFLNQLFDGARNDEIQSVMRREKVISCLEIGASKIERLLTISP